MAEIRDAWQRLLVIAARQHGLVTRDQVLKAGGSEQWLRRCIGLKDLVKIGWRV